MATVRFSYGEERARGIARTVERLLREVVQHERTRFRGMVRRDEHQVAGVVTPAQSADDGRLARQHELLHVSVKVGELEAEAQEKFIHVRDLQVVVLLI